MSIAQIVGQGEFIKTECVERAMAMFNASYAANAVTVSPIPRRSELHNETDP